MAYRSSKRLSIRRSVYSFLAIAGLFFLYKVFLVAVWWDINVFTTSYGPLDRLPIPESELVTGMRECPPLRPGNEKVIWAFWMQGWDDIPVFNQYNVLDWTKLHDMDEWELRVLSDSNPDSSCHISKWNLDLPPTYYRISGGLVPVYPMIRADLVRSAAISCYGGFWLDTSVTLVEPIENFCGQLYLPETHNNAKGICGFSNLPDDWHKLPMGERLYMFENWAFGARQNDTFMQAWHATFLQFWHDRTHAGGIHWYAPYKDLPFALEDMYLSQHTAFMKVLHLDEGMEEYFTNFGKLVSAPAELWRICGEDWNRATHRLVDESPPGPDLIAAVEGQPALKLPNWMSKKIKGYSNSQLMPGSIMDQVRHQVAAVAEGRRF